MARYTEQVYPVKKLVPLTREMAEQIRDYRFAERIESENEAIRRLIEAGLSAAGKSGPSSGGEGEGKTDAPSKPPPRAKTNPTRFDR